MGMEMDNRDFQENEELNTVRDAGGAPANARGVKFPLSHKEKRRPEAPLRSLQILQ